MQSTTTKSAFWAGFRDSAPFLIVAAPFAVLFGVVATEAGLNVFETLAFSVVVIAGAAQFTALSLMRAIAAYFLVDQTYAVSYQKFETAPEMSAAQRFAYFMGTMTPICPMWYVFTLVGAVIGKQIPESWALDFVVPITFLALIGPMLRTGAHIVAALVGITVALLCAGLPWAGRRPPSTPMAATPFALYRCRRAARFGRALGGLARCHRRHPGCASAGRGDCDLCGHGIKAKPPWPAPARPSGLALWLVLVL